MTLANLQFHLTDHALAQYCERVEQTTHPALMRQCIEQIQAHQYTRTGEFIHLAGVWWVFKIRAGTLHFVTCYGRTALDIPAAKRWARRQRDRIDLRTMI